MCQPVTSADVPAWQVRAERGLLGVVFLVGLFLRLDRFQSVPRGVLYDEAFNGTDALRILAGWRPIFLPANYGREALFIYGQALAIGLFGASDWALRVPAILSGVLTLPASYLLIRRLFGRRVALLGCAWLAVSLWHVMYSRIGLRTILLPLVLAAAFYCLWRGLDRLASGHASPTGRGALAWFALAGAFVGLAQYTYTTARFAPVAVLAFAAYLALFHRADFRRALPGFVVVGLVSFLVFAPEGWHFLRHPEDFVNRAEQVSALNPNLDSSMSLATPSDAVGYSVVQSLGMFTFHGDDQWDRNVPGRPIFDPVSSVFVVVGLALLVRRVREPRAAFVLIWLLVMLVPSMISIRNVPNFLRVTGLIPAVFLVPALGLDGLWRAGEARLTGRARAVPLAVVAVAFAVGALLTYRGYFGLWAHQADVSETFNADRWLALGSARGLSGPSGATIFAGAGNADEPLQRYALAGTDPAAVRTFNGQRSLIFPVDPIPTTYVFSARDLPPSPLVARYFGSTPGQPIAVAPDGETVLRLELPANRPDFAPDHPLAARFGDSLQVYGYDLPRDARAGDTLTVRWYWKIVGRDQRDLYFFNQLYDGKDRRGAVDDHAFAPGYWPVGTTGISSFDLKVDPTLPTGAYSVLVGVYDRDTLTRLPVIDGLGRTAGSQISLGPIKVHGAAPLAATAPPHPSPAHLADGIDLRGYGLQPAGNPPGSLALTLVWAARGRPSRDYTVFVHLLDAQGHVVAQADGPPQGGTYPTSIWDAGETIADVHPIRAARPLPPGTYQLEVGLYQPDSGRRLPVIDAAGHPIDDRIVIPGLTIPP
jgi:4-amino-4-deoxy-L-arabinose transferase-like glycosyltransferase